eukprot:m.14776 g.14776  ORF g.14776 m.14776 type:complete len:124 (+) comp4366_c0_seq1:224-595(+)
MFSRCFQWGASFIFKNNRSLALAGSLSSVSLSSISNSTTSTVAFQAQRSSLSTMTETLRTKVCIVGSGPAAHTAAICGSMLLCFGLKTTTKFKLSLACSLRFCYLSLSFHFLSFRLCCRLCSC